MNDNKPDVIPLQISGAIDTDLTKLTGNELMKWGLLNLWNTSEEGAYAVRHGKDAVNDFGRPHKGKPDGIDRTATGKNFFERAFPILFPFGRGGIEADRPNEVGFSQHVRWCLRFHDGRFRRHETFSFTAFGIQQRRQALGAARVQTRRKDFEKDAHVLATITAEKLKEAQIQEDKGQKVTDPAILLLKSHIHTAAGKVMGSNASKHRLKSQIWSTSISEGPPSLWVTINPDDLHDPIPQIFAGENIDLDQFMSIVDSVDAGHKRAQNIAGNPYSSAKFFHFIIRAVIRTLFGARKTQHQFHADKGIFGFISAYFGVVESQGRGSLHLHILIWLRHVPNVSEMEELLKSEEFREHIREFIRQNCRAYVPGLESKDAVRNTPNKVDIAYSRPPNPHHGTLMEYEKSCENFELQVARAKQVHSCELRRCLKVDSRGCLVCKRRAPFEVAQEPYVLENGNWCPKRLYEFMNGWNPSISVCLRCNNDSKVLLNGPETINISYYVTGYSHKNQQKSHNISAVVAKTQAYDVEHTTYTDSLQDQQRLLLFRIINAINSEQELAAPMVISFLMGWGDLYQSHYYQSVYWSSFVSVLMKAHPDLSNTQDHHREEKTSTAVSETSLVQSDDQEVEEGLLHNDEYQPSKDDEEGENTDEMGILELDQKGKIYVKSQVTDYKYRGSGLETYNVYDFFANTWEDKEQHSKKKQSNERYKHYDSCRGIYCANDISSIFEVDDNDAPLEDQNIETEVSTF